MVTRRKPGLPVSIFANSTARDLEQQIEALDLRIVEAAHDPRERHRLFSDKAKLTRKLAAIRKLTGRH